MRNAEAELATVYASVESGLSETQRGRLGTVQEAWQNYRDKERAYLVARGLNENDINGWLNNLTWSRIDRLLRILEPARRSTSSINFALADRELNAAYQEIREGLRWRDAPKREPLKTAELAWIEYRDRSAAAESVIGPHPRISRNRVKAELTWERTIVLYGLYRDFPWFSDSPDIDLEIGVAAFRSDDARVWEEGIKVLIGKGTDALPAILCHPLMSERSAYERIRSVIKASGSSAFPILMRCLEDPDFQYKRRLLAVLPATGTDAIPVLLEEAEKREPKTCGVALNSLGEFEEAAVDALPLLLELTSAPPEANGLDAEVRIQAARAAIRIAPECPEVRSGVINICRAPDGTIEEGTRDLLEYLGPEAVILLPELVRSARGKEPFAGYHVARIITPECTDLVPSLIDALCDSEAQEWNYIRDSLVKIGAPAAPALEQRLSDQQPLIFCRVVETLAAMKAAPKDAMSRLVDLARSEECSAAVLAMETLSRCGAVAADAVPDLLEIAKSEDLMRAIPALYAVGGMKDAAKSVVPDLVTLFECRKPGVSAAALDALHAIDPKNRVVRDHYPKPPYVLDPFLESGCYQEPDFTYERGMYNVIRADFNSDGIEDVAISDDDSSFGTGGGDWTLYLKVADGGYRILDKFLAPRGFTLYTGKRGVGYMKVYWHMSASEGTDTLYAIASDCLKELGAVDLIKDEEQEMAPVIPGERLPIPEGCTETSYWADQVKIGAPMAF